MRDVPKFYDPLAPTEKTPAEKGAERVVRDVPTPGAYDPFTPTKELRTERQELPSYDPFAPTQPVGEPMDTLAIQEELRRIRQKEIDYPEGTWEHVHTALKNTWLSTRAALWDVGTFLRMPQYYMEKGINRGVQSLEDKGVIANESAELLNHFLNLQARTVPFGDPGHTAAADIATMAEKSVALKERVRPTKSLFDAIEDGNAGEIAMAAVHGALGYVPSIIVGAATKGLGFIPMFAGGGFVDAAKYKSELTDRELRELIESYDPDVVVPTIIGGIAGALERYGLMKVQAAIFKAPLKTSTNKAIAQFLAVSGRQGVINWAEAGLMDYNLHYAKTGSFDDAAGHFARYMISREGLNAGAEAIAGTMLMMGLGRGARSYNAAYRGKEKTEIKSFSTPERDISFVGADGSYFLQQAELSEAAAQEAIVNLKEANPDIDFELIPFKDKYSIKASEPYARGREYVNVLLDGKDGWLEKGSARRELAGIAILGKDIEGNVFEIIERPDMETYRVLTAEGTLIDKKVVDVVDFVEMEHEQFENTVKQSQFKKQERQREHDEMIREVADESSENFAKARTNPETGMIHPVADQHGTPVAYIVKGDPGKPVGGGNILFAIDAKEPGRPQPYNPKAYPTHKISGENPEQFKANMAEGMVDAQVSEKAEKDARLEAEKKVILTAKPFEVGENVMYKDQKGIVIEAENQDGEAYDTPPEIRVRVEAPDGTEKIVAVPQAEYDQVKTGWDVVEHTGEKAPEEAAPAVAPTIEFTAGKHADNFIIAETETEKRYEGQKIYHTQKAAEAAAQALQEEYSQIAFEVVDITDRSSPENKNQFKIVGVFEKPALEVAPEAPVEVLPEAPVERPTEVAPEVTPEGVVVPEKELTKEQEVSRHNLLIDRVDQHNKIPEAHNRKREDLRKDITRVANELGFKVGMKKGMLQVHDADGNLIKRIRVPTKIDHVRLADFSPEFQEFANKFMDAPELMIGYPMGGLSNQQKLQAIRNIKDTTKEPTVAATTFLNDLKKIFDEGGMHVQQIDKRVFVPMEDILRVADEARADQDVIDTVAPAKDNITRMLDSYIKEDGTIDIDKIISDIAEDSDSFKMHPFELTDAEITGLQKLLADETRREQIQAGYKEIRDAEDAARRGYVPPTHEEIERVVREIPEAEREIARADRSEVEVVLPATFKDKEYDFRAIEGAEGLMIRYGKRKLSGRIASEDVSDKIHIHQAEKGEPGDIKLTTAEARQIIDAFDNTLNEAVQGDIDALKEQVQRAEKRFLPPDDVRRRLVDERKGLVESINRHHDEVVTALQPIIETFGNINVVRTEFELPKRLQDTSTQRIFAYSTGLYDYSAGQVYIVSANNVNPTEAVRTALHEIVGHKGLRKLLGAQREDIMNKVYRGMSESDRARIAEIYDTDLQTLIAEEYAAELAETGQNPSALDRIVGWIREALRDMFGLDMNKKDVLYMLHQSQKLMRAEHVEAQKALEGEVAPLKTMNEIVDLQEQPREILHRKFIPQKPDYPQKKFLTTREKTAEIVQNAMFAGKKLMEETIKRGGVLTDRTNFYLWENHLKSRTMHHVREFNDKLFIPLWEHVGSLEKVRGIPTSLTERYLKAKAGIEREDKGDPVADLFGRITYPEGKQAFAKRGEWTRAKAEQIVSEYEANLGAEGTRILWERVNAVNDFIVGRWQTDGMITKEQADGYRAREYYVPLRGWAEDAAADIFNFQNVEKLGVHTNDALQFIEKAEIRTSEPANPLPYLNSMATTAIIMGNKNRYKKVFGDFVRDNAEIGRDLFGLLKTYEYKTIDKAGNERWDEVAFNPTPEDFAAGRVRTKYDRTHYWRATQQEASEREVSYWEGGERVVVRVTDPEVSTSINRTNMMDPGGFLRWHSKGVRFLSQVFTSRNPIFFIPNKFIRDISQSAMFHWIRPEGDVATYLKHEFSPNAYRTVHRWKTGKLDPGYGEVLKDKHGKEIGTYDGLFKEAIEQGMLTGFVEARRKFEDVVKDSDRELRKYAGRETFTRKTFRGAFEGLVNILEYSMAQSEYTTRFNTYVTARQSGLSKLHATQMAKNVTVNFDRKGTFAPIAQSWIAFPNARMQSAAQKYELHNINPAKYWTGVAAFGILGYTLTEVFRNMAFGDDEENPYDNVPDYLKYTHLVIPGVLPGDRMLNIPLPFEWRMWWAAGVITNMMHNKQKSISDGTFDMVDQIIFGFAPIGGSLRPSTDPYAHTLAKIPGVRGVVPTTVVPLFDLIVNETFTGAQIYKAPYVKTQKKYEPAYMRSMPYVGKHFLAFSKALNKVGGGTDLVPATIDPVTGEYKLARRIFDINPSAIEHVADYAIGGLGRFGNQVIKTAVSAAEVALGVEDAKIEERNIPIYSRFISTPRKNMQYYHLYWELGDQMRTRDHFRRQARKEGDPHGVLKTYREGSMMQAEQVFNRYKKRIDQLGLRIDIQDNKEKKQELSKERDALIKEAVIKVNEIQKE